MGNRGVGGAAGIALGLMQDIGRADLDFLGLDKAEQTSLVDSADQGPPPSDRGFHPAHITFVKHYDC